MISERQLKKLNRKPSDPEIPGSNCNIWGLCGDHNVVWRSMQPVCGLSTRLLNGFRTPLFSVTEVECSRLGALASVAGGARNHLGWAWLTGSRAAQDGSTALHLAAFNGHGAAITKLLAAKADIHATDEVRGEGGAEGLVARGVLGSLICSFGLDFSTWVLG